MSHPSHVEYTEFHNRYDHAAKHALRAERGHITADSLSNSQRLAPGPLVGRWDNLRHATSAPRHPPSPEKQHHRKKHDVGIDACDKRRTHLFIDLPGTTFNATTWERFVSKAAAEAPRSPVSPGSPMQRALSTTRAQSPDKIASYRGAASRIKALRAIPQPHSPSSLMSPSSTASRSMFSTPEPAI